MLEEMREELGDLNASKMPEQLKKGRRERLERWIEASNKLENRNAEIHGRCLRQSKELKQAEEDLLEQQESNRVLSWLTLIMAIVLTITIYWVLS
jgi:hypothetical protein